jgi:citrate lyase beta subunit
MTCCGYKEDEDQEKKVALQGRGHFQVGVVGLVAIDHGQIQSAHAAFLATATEVT